MCNNWPKRSVCTKTHLTRASGRCVAVAFIGLAGHEGAFNICTFWLVEALTAQHEFDPALDLFLNMLEQAGSCGLFSEEIDPVSKRALGNYPQAFTHIGLINAALSLNKCVQSSQS